MGTESLVGRSHGCKDIRQKVIIYQAYFRTSGYKRYEQIFGANLKGFRLLFLTQTRARLTALCNLVAAMRPSDFIWLTDQDGIITQGVAEAVWVRGGKMEAPCQSILGSEMPVPRDDIASGQ